MLVLKVLIACVGSAYRYTTYGHRLGAPTDALEKVCRRERIGKYVATYPVITQGHRSCVCTVINLLAAAAVIVSALGVIFAVVVTVLLLRL